MEHSLLFDDLRSYAMAIVSRERDLGSFGSFFCLVESYALNEDYFKHRGIDMKLSVAQVKATVKSVARWTWEHRDYRIATSPFELGFFDDDYNQISTQPDATERRKKRKEWIKNKKRIT